MVSLHVIVLVIECFVDHFFNLANETIKHAHLYMTGQKAANAYDAALVQILMTDLTCLTSYHCVVNTTTFVKTVVEMEMIVRFCTLT